MRQPETLGGNTSWSQTNGYDRYGNRWIDLGGGNQSLYFTATTNRITGWSYDASGNLLNDGVHNYTFDAENKISKVDNVSAYVYDGAGQRVRKFVGENTRFVYGLGGQLIMEFDGASGNLKKEYVYGGGTMITIAPNGKGSLGVQYATSDMLGSPRVVTNSSGSVVSRHDYKPFGEELFAGTGGRTTGMGFSVSDGNRQKFTGYERDSETGLDFAQARYNSSTQGRFTSPDSLLGSIGNPQTLNRYAYVTNNPLKFTDPTGHEMYSATTHGPERGMGVVNSTDHIFSEFMIPQSEAELDHAQRVQNTYDAADASAALAVGNFDTLTSILDRNQNVGLSVGGLELYGELATAFVDGYSQPVELAQFPLGPPIDPEAIAIKNGLRTVAKLVQKARKPDFYILTGAWGVQGSVAVTRGCTFTISLGGTAGNVASLMAGWLLPLDRPLERDVISFLTGPSFGADIFWNPWTKTGAGVGGGFIRSPENPGTRWAVTLGLGLGGGFSGGNGWAPNWRDLTRRYFP